MTIDMVSDLKIVIDSNVIISSLVFGGKPEELIKKVLLKGIKVYTSIQLVSELSSPIFFYISIVRLNMFHRLQPRPKIFPVHQKSWHF